MDAFDHAAAAEKLLNPPFTDVDTFMIASDRDIEMAKVHALIAIAKSLDPNSSR